MKVLYAVMYTVNADFTGASYVEDNTEELGYKVTLVGLTEKQIGESPRVKNRIDKLGFNPTNDTEQEGLSTAKLSYIITMLAEQEPNHVMGILSIAQGKWLYDNHPNFMPKQTKEV